MSPKGNISQIYKAGDFGVVKMRKKKSVSGCFMEVLTICPSVTFSNGTGIIEL